MHTQNEVAKFIGTHGTTRATKTEVESKNKVDMAMKQTKLGYTSTTTNSTSSYSHEGYEGTKEALLRAIVLFIVVLKMPLRLVDLPIFKTLLYTAIAFGRARHHLRFVLNSTSILFYLIQM